MPLQLFNTLHKHAHGELVPRTVLLNGGDSGVMDLR